MNIGDNRMYAYVDKSTLSSTQLSDIQEKAAKYAYSLFNVDLPLWDKALLIDAYIERLARDAVNGSHREEIKIAREYRRHSF